MKRVPTVISSAAICLIVCLAWLVDHYHTNAVEYKRQRDEKTRELKTARATVDDMTERQRQLADLDTRHTQELADEKEKIALLERNLHDGRQRLRISATCKPLRETTSTHSLDDGASARLTDAAQRDYLALRERIATVTEQVSGLQDYIREQCLK
ncbi:lysis protein [Klebsiella aerogenes]